jgi:TolB-like protein/class 3 adenylate cyclase/Flp pilus assembly protein TadD
MASESASDVKFEIGHVLFIDIVGYSKLLINEQTEQLQKLKEIVRGTEQVGLAEAERKLLRLPTGDGGALVFRNNPEAPVLCAIEIAKALRKHPKVRVRMGIHSGPVNEVVDLNEQANIAGAGINTAQRVMDCGDAGHILLSKRVMDDLEQYPQWRGHLHDLGETEVKHGVRLHLFNLCGENFGNSEMPARWQRAKVNPTKRSRIALLWLVTSIVLIGTVATWIWRSRLQLSNLPADKSIAVLPFVDMSQTKDQEYFCDGISEEILDALAKVDGLRVVARTSSFSFKGKNTDVSEVANKLNVGNVLEGSLRREGNRIRITAQLINARDSFHLWSETYERELKDVFAVQDDITRAIVDALKVKLAIAVPAKRESSSEAYDLYLQGLYFSNKSDEESLRKSLNLFQRALDKDPNSARAWAGIAKAWDWLADAYVKPLDAFPVMKAAAEKAIALDANNAEAHVYLSDAKRVLDRDMTGAMAELERALQLDPNSASAHMFSSLNNLIEGNFEAAATHMREAVKADPLSPIVANFSAISYFLRGEYDAAIAEGKRTLELDPNYLYQTSVIADAYREKGMYNDAIALFKKAQEITGTPQSGLAITYARIGRQSEAREILEDLKKIAAAKYMPKEEIAAVYVALNEKDEAFKWLDLACEDHGGALEAITLRPVFQPLHSDPRFAEILRRIGLDPAKVLSQPSQ